MSSNGSLEREKRADTDHEVITPLSERWSPRAFADRPVEEEKLQQILEAARWAASSYNEQPWRYIIARKKNQQRFNQMLGCLVEFNQTWARTAPVLMLSFYKTTFSENGNVNRCASHDVGAASAQLTAQATSLDLYVHQMAGIDREAIRQRYRVPADYEPMVALAVGYLGDPSTLPDDIEEKEYGARSRKELRDIVFEDAWGQPADLAR